MQKRQYILYFIVVISFFILLTQLSACFTSGRSGGVYNIGEETRVNVVLTTWNVCGCFDEKESSAADSIIGNPALFSEIDKGSTADSIWRNGVYHPQYIQPDLAEVFGIEAADTAKRQMINGQYVYLYCVINAAKPLDVYSDVRTGLDCSHYVNGKRLERASIQGLNIYPMHLEKGSNYYVVKAKITGEDLSLETTLYDSVSIARLYAEGQSCNIIYPQRDSVSHVVMLTNAHQNLLRTPVSLRFTDVNGNEICEPIRLKRDSFLYYIPGMKNNVSYMCEMSMCGATVRQPVLCGKDDDAYSRFVRIRGKMPDAHPRSAEIDEILYRYKFLLSHPSRYEGDWWWQFKITPLSYQLEHVLSHLDGTYGDSDSEFNLQFISYTSRQDSSIQRYLLMHPNKIKSGKKMPLVVVVRPAVEKMYHFFTCPQLARQWALNQMQALSDRFGYVVMMPEMRTYQYEKLSAAAKTEMLLAIKDVCEHYDIDTTRIFLHANCSGGYRALQMATDYPSRFRAIALYAPTYMPRAGEYYQRAGTPALKLENLKGKPVFIQGDPCDEHSPYQTYADLIDDCKRCGIPMTLLLKRNSGRFYNVVLVGEEAFDFYMEESNRR